MPDPLNATAASLLGFLNVGELTGYALVRVADKRIGRLWSLTRSQVYREPADLQRRGLVERGAAGPRAARPYRLTVPGRETVVDWMARMPGEETIRNPLLLTVALGEHLDGSRLAENLARHRESHRDRVAGYREVEEAHGAAMGPYRRSTLAFGIRYEEAVLAWSDEVCPQLAPDGGPED